MGTPGPPLPTFRLRTPAPATLTSLLFLKLTPQAFPGLQDLFSCFSLHFDVSSLRSLVKCLFISEISRTSLPIKPPCLPSLLCFFSILFFFLPSFMLFILLVYCLQASAHWNRYSTKVTFCLLCSLLYSQHLE